MYFGFGLRICVGGRVPYFFPPLYSDFLCENDKFLLNGNLMVCY